MFKASLGTYPAPSKVTSGPDWSRTSYLEDFTLALYQLSYRPMWIGSPIRS